MGFWKSPSFKSLNREWRDKLIASDFKDIEDENGNLAQKDHRTIAFASPECTEAFYSALDEYLNTSKQITLRDRKILELFSMGVYITGSVGIVAQTGWSDRTIRYVIAKHKPLFLKLK